MAPALPDTLVRIRLAAVPDIIESMPKQFSPAEFADLACLSIDEVQAYLSSGLLDPEGDGLLDEYDALRLQYIQMLRHRGMTTEEMAAKQRDGSLEVPFLGTQLFRKPGRLYSLEEAAAKLGLTTDQIVSLQTAVGLIGPPTYTDSDLSSFAAAKTVLDSGLPWDAILEVGRVYGDAFRRIGQTEVRLIHNYIHVPLASAGVDDGEIGDQTAKVLSALQPVLGPLLEVFHMSYVMREAARDSVMHLQSKEYGRGGSESLESAIVFVDLTSFTALAQVRGDQIAADVLDRFDVVVRTLVLEHEGTLVKQIGDAFMLAFGDPLDAVRFCLAINEAVQAEEEFLALRIGVHAGPVLYRVGDYVGNTVNLASRLAAEAMPEEILVSEKVAESAQAAGISTVSAGVRLMRGGSEPLQVFRVVHPLGSPERRDPVCGALVGEPPAARLIRDGAEVVFHSEECLRLFLKGEITVS